MKSPIHRFYRLAQGHALPDIPPHGASLVVWHWKPTWRRPLPPGQRELKFLVWFLFAKLKLFPPDGYGVCLIEEAGKTLHRSCVFPRFFRFPFMGVADLQVGDTWTAPSARGRRLATYALKEICSLHHATGGAVWYLVEDTNRASIKVAERAGLSLVGFGSKHPRFGLGFFGYYSIDRSMGASDF